MLSVLLLAACTYCSVDGPLDYTRDDLWICKGGVDDACDEPQQVATLLRNGEVQTELEARSPDLDLACFVLYPTIDERLGPGLHQDVESVPGPREWAANLARPLQEVCEVYVPVYRQAVIGTYRGAETKKEVKCLDNAYDDVFDAFDHFLAVEPERPFVLVGHSQGAQHLARLVREQIEGNQAVRERMVAAYLLGWPLGTDGSATGGSFEWIPVCTDATTPGCVIAYGSYLAGDSPPERTRFDEGSTRMCVNPAEPGATGPVALRPLLIAGDTALLNLPDSVPSDALVAVDELFTAQCVDVGEGVTGLELDPQRDDVTFNQKALVGSDLRAHALDVSLALRDLVDDMRQRTP